MWRPLAFLGVLAAILGAWAAGIDHAEQARRMERNRVGVLLAPEERENLPLAAIRIEHGDRRWIYGKVKGRWRCLPYHEAPADASALLRLATLLVEAEGVVRTREADEAPSFGINTADTIRVELCGPGVLSDPDGDVLFAFDIGASPAGQDRTFVRRRGRPEIWSIGADVRSLLLSPPGDPRPPLLERAVVPSDWGGWERGLRRVFVDRAEGASLELHKRSVELDPATRKPGDVPWAWFLVSAEGEQRAASGPSTAYSLFLRIAPHGAVLPRDQREELGLGAPRVIVTFEPVDGEPLQIVLGSPDAAGRVAAWVEATQTLYLVPQEVAELLAPAPGLFAPGSEANPWDPWLQRASELRGASPFGR